MGEEKDPKLIFGQQKGEICTMMTVPTRRLRRFIDAFNDFHARQEIVTEEQLIERGGFNRQYTRTWIRWLMKLGIVEIVSVQKEGKKILGCSFRINGKIPEELAVALTNEHRITPSITLAYSVGPSSHASIRSASTILKKVEKRTRRKVSTIKTDQSIVKVLVRIEELLKEILAVWKK